MATIVIVTSSFPFTGGEQFLETEIEFWGVILGSCDPLVRDRQGCAAQCAVRNRGGPHSCSNPDETQEGRIPVRQPILKDLPQRDRLSAVDRQTETRDALSGRTGDVANLLDCPGVAQSLLRMRRHRPRLHVLERC
jgi:hypothetical protein